MGNRLEKRSILVLRQGRVVVTILLMLVASAALARAGTPGAAQVADLKLPADLVYERVVGPDSAVVFRHTTHVDYEGNRCTGCHSKLYKLLTPTRRATHQEMDARGSCGTCHDGKHAFDTRASESCRSCHAGRRALAAAAPGATGQAPAAFKGPPPIVYKPTEQSPGEVAFRHDTHLGKRISCKTCHPKPFAMASAGARPDGAMHEGSACGMCHDGRKSFGTEDDKSCAKCHNERKGAR
jgi:c(7)-type cytochrome triheme protein